MLATANRLKSNLAGVRTSSNLTAAEITESLRNRLSEWSTVSPFLVQPIPSGENWRIDSFWQIKGICGAIADSVATKLKRCGFPNSNHIADQTPSFVWEAMVRTSGSGQTIGFPIGFAHFVAYRRALKIHYSERRLEQLLAIIALLSSAIFTVPPAWLKGAHAAAPLDQLILTEEGQRLAATMARLSPQSLAVVERRFWQAQTLRQISEWLAGPASNPPHKPGELAVGHAVKTLRRILTDTSPTPPRGHSVGSGILLSNPSLKRIRHAPQIAIPWEPLAIGGTASSDVQLTNVA